MIENRNPQENLVCGEIQYMTDEGPLHSDICPSEHSFNNIADDSEYRTMLHGCLDEWLKKSNGTGYFFIGDSRYYRLIPDELDQDDATDLIRKITTPIPKER